MVDVHKPLRTFNVSLILLFYSEINEKKSNTVHIWCIKIDNR